MTKQIQQNYKKPKNRNPIVKAVKKLRNCFKTDIL